MKREMPSSKIMSIQEVSEYLNIPVSTVYYLAQKGKIKGAKFGRHWRFLEEGILDSLRGGAARDAK